MGPSSFSGRYRSSSKFLSPTLAYSRFAMRLAPSGTAGPFGWSPLPGWPAARGAGPTASAAARAIITRMRFIVTLLAHLHRRRVARSSHGPVGRLAAFRDRIRNAHQQAL